MSFLFLSSDLANKRRKKLDLLNGRSLFSPPDSILSEYNRAFLFLSRVKRCQLALLHVWRTDVTGGRAARMSARAGQVRGQRAEGDGFQIDILE